MEPALPAIYWRGPGYPLSEHWRHCLLSKVVHGPYLDPFLVPRGRDRVRGHDRGLDHVRRIPRSQCAQKPLLLQP